MDEKYIVGYCAECGNAIYDDEKYYIGDDGERLCSVECVMDHYNVVEVNEQ